MAKFCRLTPAEGRYKAEGSFLTDFVHKAAHLLPDPSKLTKYIVFFMKILKNNIRGTFHVEGGPFTFREDVSR